MVEPWVTYADLPAPLPVLPGGEADWADPIALASEVLWALSGRRWAGVTTRTVEVVAPAPADDFPPGWDLTWGTVSAPHVEAGRLVNRPCGCSAPAEVRLPGSPSRVLSVTVSGALRDPASYRLNGQYLQDLSGTGWPTCEPGMVVQYESGKEPPAAGKAAAGLLAREFGKAIIGDPSCQLPANVTSVTRQGITQTIVPATQIIALGQTGVVSADLWLATVNPHRLTRRARAWSPDTHPRTYLRSTP